MCFTNFIFIWKDGSDRHWVPNLLGLFILWWQLSSKSHSSLLFFFASLAPPGSQSGA